MSNTPKTNPDTQSNEPQDVHLSPEEQQVINDNLFDLMGSSSPTQSDKTVEPMSEDDYWRIMLNNYEKDGDLPYGDKQRLIGLNEFITARENRIRLDELQQLNLMIIGFKTKDQVQNEISHRIAYLRRNESHDDE